MVGYDPAWLTIRADRDALKALKAAGCITKKIRLPDLPYDSLETILFAESAATFEDLTLSGPTSSGRRAGFPQSSSSEPTGFAWRDDEIYAPAAKRGPKSKWLPHCSVFWGRLYDDSRFIRLAMALERAVNLRERLRTPLFDRQGDLIMSDKPIIGGCQCGAVRYELSEPLHDVAHCHCSMCRKAHGALFVSFGRTKRDNLSLTGEANLDGYESSRGIVRRFCKTCGGQIVITSQDAPEECFIALGSLDAGQAPGHDKATERHIFWESRVTWYDPSDDLPKVTEYGE